MYYSPARWYCSRGGQCDHWIPHRGKAIRIARLLFLSLRDAKRRGNPYGIAAIRNAWVLIQGLLEQGKWREAMVIGIADETRIARENRRSKVILKYFHCLGRHELSYCPQYERRQADEFEIISPCWFWQAAIRHDARKCGRYCWKTIACQRGVFGGSRRVPLWQCCCFCFI